MLIMNLVSGVFGTADVVKYDPSVAAKAAVQRAYVRVWEHGGTLPASRSGVCPLV